MGKNRYFLIVRDKISNEVLSVPFSSDEIIGNGNQDLQTENSLCDIDLFTTMFKNQSELIVYLNRKGIINSYDSDIYIVARNGDNINAMECVYSEDIFGKELRSIAGSKRKNEFDNRSISIVFDDFARKMFASDDFFYFVTYGFSNIYSKFIDYYKEAQDISDMLNARLKDGAWATKSYHLIHNIVEAYTSYRKYGRDIFNRGAYEKEKIEKNRNSVLENVKVITEKGYDSEQLSLFGERESIDKQAYILDNLDKLMVEAFIEENGVRFNRDFFPKYDGEAFQDELYSLLDSDCLSSLLSYARDSKALKSSMNHDLLDFKARLDRDKLLLLNDFRVNPSLLDRVYSFLLLYNKCMRDNGMDSCEYGRVYSKK